MNRPKRSSTIQPTGGTTLNKPRYSPPDTTTADSTAIVPQGSDPTVIAKVVEEELAKPSVHADDTKPHGNETLEENKTEELLDETSKPQSIKVGSFIVSHGVDATLSIIPADDTADADLTLPATETILTNPQTKQRIFVMVAKLNEEPSPESSTAEQQPQPEQVAEPPASPVGSETLSTADTTEAAT